MRRPLDWIVVSISLMVLFANRMLTDSDPIPVATVPDLANVIEDETDSASPFAYIREDGSQVFLPDVGPRLASQARPEPATATSAVYTWSLPMATPASDTRSFTSAAPSSR